MAIDDLRQERLDLIAKELVDRTPNQAKLVVSKERLLREIGAKLAIKSPESRN